MGKKRTTTNTNQTTTRNSQFNNQNNQSESYLRGGGQSAQQNPWAAAIPGLETILGDSGSAYKLGQANAGPNANQVTGTDLGAKIAGLNAGWMGNIAKEGLNTARDISAGNVGGTGKFDMSYLGDPYSFAKLNLADPTQVGSTIQGVAGDRPAYSINDLTDNISALTSIAPDNTAAFNSATQGAIAPIMQKLTTEAIPSLLSKQALTGGTSSRHAIQADNLASSFGTAIGDALATKGLDLASLNSGDFRTLAGLGGENTFNVRNLQSSDWGKLADIGSNAFMQNQQLATQYQTAAEQAAAQQAMARDQINLNAFENWQNRNQSATGLQLGAAQLLPGMEAQAYSNELDPARTISGIGDQQKAYTDQSIWGPLSNYSSLISPIAGLGGSQTGSSFDFGSGNSSGTQSGTQSGTSNTTGTQTQTQSGGMGSIIKGLAGAAGLAMPFLAPALAPAALGSSALGGLSGIGGSIAGAASSLAPLTMNPISSYANARSW